VNCPPFVQPWTVNWCGCHTGGNASEWDAGIKHRTVQSVAPTEEVVSVAFIREKVLRVVNDSVEDGNIDRLIRVATGTVQDYCRCAMKPQTFRMTLTGLPSGRIRLQRNPVIEISSFDYVDADGNAQQLAVSPADFQLLPSGDYTMAELWPSVGESWPSVQSGHQFPVTITYRAGYENEDALGFLQYQQGVALLVGEMYKQRELSVVGTSIVPAPIQVSTLCKVWY
jgi:uncharacterized phiE125 gp8 family phage protein